VTIATVVMVRSPHVSNSGALSAADPARPLGQATCNLETPVLSAVLHRGVLRGGRDRPKCVPAEESCYPGVRLGVTPKGVLTPIIHAVALNVFRRAGGVHGCPRIGQVGLGREHAGFGVIDRTVTREAPRIGAGGGCPGVLRR